MISKRLRQVTLLAASLLLTLTACVSTKKEAVDDPHAPIPIDAVTRVFDTKSGEELTIAQLCDRLAKADAVFLGETHIDEVTHRVEDEVYAGLLERHDGRVVLAMEMSSDMVGA